MDDPSFVVGDFENCLGCAVGDAIEVRIAKADQELWEDHGRRDGGPNARLICYVEGRIRRHPCSDPVKDFGPYGATQKDFGLQKSRGLYSVKISRTVRVSITSE